MKRIHVLTSLTRFFEFLHHYIIILGTIDK